MSSRDCLLFDWWHRYSGPVVMFVIWATLKNLCLLTC